VAAADLFIDAADPKAASAVIGSPPELSDAMDLGDLQDLAAQATANLITVMVNKDGTVSFALPRAEVGQGITTTFAMLIAEEMDIAVDRVKVHLENARPELQFNQLTGGSNSVRSLYTPVRTAAATARSQMMHVAASRWKVDASSLTVSDGVIRAADGRTASYGSLAQHAAATRTTRMLVQLKDDSEFKVIGRPHKRLDAHEIVTGRKKFAMDMVIPGAWPTMICRPPTINGTVKRVHNRAAVLKMDGITHVATISTGVAIRGRTFGQVIDAVRALKVSWGPGSVDHITVDHLKSELASVALPFADTAVTGASKEVTRRFTFHFASNSPLEPNCAIARVSKTKAEIWGSLKVPIVAQKLISEKVGLQPDQVTVHVTQGGGSFGRHLFCDAALEAAEASKKFGKPVKLMWARTDDFRHGRVHPMAMSNVRAVYSGTNVVSYEQRHTSVDTDFTHGFGDVITAYAATLPGGNETGYAQTIFNLTANVSYNYGVTIRLLPRWSRASTPAA
jgi:isoquinoline 1-oxidoreductase beta subunit